MADNTEILQLASQEVKRLGTNVSELHANVKDKLDGVTDRLDAMETSFKRGGGFIAGGETALTAEQREYKTAFENFVRHGEETNLKAMQRKALHSGSDPDGGYLVPHQIADRVIRKIFEISPLRQLANVQTISSADIELLVDADEAGAEWVDEVSPRAETKTPQLGKKRIVAHELSAAPQVSQRLLEDSVVNIDTWLGDKLGQRFARAEGAAFVKGTGVGQPRGFLTYPAGDQGGAIRQLMTGAVTGFPDGSGTADALLAMIYELKSAYRANGKWLMPRSVQLSVRQLKDERGAYLWQPGLKEGQPDRLLGYPVYDAEDMPGMVAGSLSVAFGDWNEAYQIIDRVGMTILRDPFTKKPNVEFNARKRVGGDVVNPDALVILKTGV